VPRPRTFLGRLERLIWIAEPLVAGTLSVACVIGIAFYAIRAPDPADARAAWIVVAILSPFLYWLYRVERRRYAERFGSNARPG
jgi:hypothetical protein